MIKHILKLLRVKHWIKNSFTFAPLIFSLNFLNIPLVTKSIILFIIFCLTSSLVYILNDIVDKERDSHHPTKRNRPIASGAISVPMAVVMAIIVVIAIATGSFFFLNLYTVLILASYLGLNIFYSFFLKHKVIIDVMTIAVCFVLRVLAGSFAIEVTLSSWLFLCTLFISLFLGFGKRRHELIITGNGHDNGEVNDAAGNHRPVLDKYNVQLLDYMIVVSVTLTIICYSLYVISPDTIKRFNTEKLVFTVPFVVYSLFRYMHAIYKRKAGGDIAEVVLSDISLIVAIGLYGVLVLFLLSFK